MKILSRYIGLTIAAGIGVVMLVLIGMDIFIQFLNEIEDIGQGNYGVWQALVVATLGVPLSVYQFFPMAGLVGSLLGLSSLANHSELISMRAAGMSILQITLAVLRTTCLILLLVTFMGEWIAPHGMHAADSLKTFYISKGQALNTTIGSWLREGNTFMMVNHVDNNKQLSDILWFSFDNHQQMIEAGQAEKAKFIDHQWQLENVKRSKILPLDKTLQKTLRSCVGEHAHDKNCHLQPSILQVKSSTVATLNWPLELNPKLLRLSLVNPLEMSLSDLYRYIHYRQNNGLQAGQYELIFWQRVFQPFATIIMILLATPFIFGPLRSVTLGLRLLAGIGMGMIFYFANQLFGPFSLVYQLSPLLAAAVPPGVFLLLAVWLYRRAR